MNALFSRVARWRVPSQEEGSGDNETQARHLRLIKVRTGREETRDGGSKDRGEEDRTKHRYTRFTRRKVTKEIVWIIEIQKYSP